MRHAPGLLFLLLASTVAGARPTSQPTTRISIDTSDVPAMADYAARVQKVADAWYPKLVADLPSKGFAAPTQITIVFRRDYNGVAATMNDRIVCSARYFLQHPDDLGAVVHELVHVVQHYTHGDRPGWLTEGIADELRFYEYEPASRRPKPNPAKAKYSDSYQTTAAFLNWAQTTFDPQLIVKLNAACREARYRESIWKDLTGKTLSELGDAWRASLVKTH